MVVYPFGEFYLSVCTMTGEELKQIQENPELLVRFIPREQAVLQFREVYEAAIGYDELSQGLL